MVKWVCYQCHERSTGNAAGWFIARWVPGILNRLQKPDRYLHSQECKDRYCEQEQKELSSESPDEE